MSRGRQTVWALIAFLLMLSIAGPATAVPPAELILPGSQPRAILEGLGLQQELIQPVLHSAEGSQACSSCHVSGPGTGILHEWRGSMMANASRDPLMWAALSVAQKSFPEAGDTCLRCHVSKGWLGDRSQPPDGSSLLQASTSPDQLADGDGVTCHLCHRLADPSGLEAPLIVGKQAAGFEAAGAACKTGDRVDGVLREGVACDSITGEPCSGASACEPQAFLGNAMFSIFQDLADTRLGPYTAADAVAPHARRQSLFQRDAALCGTCHDVSNPIVGDLAPGHGRLGEPLPAGAFEGSLGGPLAGKAGFRNPPYAYGTEQRTYSEWFASRFASTLVAEADPDDDSLVPPDLMADGGVVRRVWEDAQVAGNNGAYADGTDRFFTCQSCHLRPTTGRGCSGGPTRKDLPLHDLTGANTWVPKAILWLDDAPLHGGQSRLRLGKNLDPGHRIAVEAGITRARETLRSAATLTLVESQEILDNTVRVTNLAGHKLFTGYPEGRRMWLNVKWFGSGEELLQEHGRYGPLDVDRDGNPATRDTMEVKTLLTPPLVLYAVESGVSQSWAEKLIDEFGLSGDTPLSFDPVSGGVERTLAHAKAAEPGSSTPSFQLLLNDTIIADNRIPPWGMDYGEARKRNALPVPDDQYLPQGTLPGDGVTYLHFDEVVLDPPVGALRGEVSLFYQTASWEYIQFLWRADEGSTGFLEGVGDDLLDAWMATGMSEPELVASIAVPEPSSGWSGVFALASLLALRRRLLSPANRALTYKSALHSGEAGGLVSRSG